MFVLGIRGTIWGKYLVQKLRSGENIKRLGKTLENSGGIIGADWETLGKCWNSLEHVR